MPGNAPSAGSIAFEGEDVLALEGAALRADVAIRGAAATRQLAKRQLTWLRGMRNVTRLDSQAPDLLSRALQALA